MAVPEIVHTLYLRQPPSASRFSDSCLRPRPRPQHQMNHYVETMKLLPMRRALIVLAAGQILLYPVIPPPAPREQNSVKQIVVMSELGLPMDMD